MFSPSPSIWDRAKLALVLNWLDYQRRKGEGRLDLWERLFEKVNKWLKSRYRGLEIPNGK